MTEADPFLEVVQRVAFLDNLIQKVISPTINAHSDSLSRMADSMTELREQQYVPARVLAQQMIDYGGVILEKSAQIQTSKIKDAIESMSTAIRQRLDDMSLQIEELYLICQALTIGNEGLMNVLALAQRERLIFLRLGTDLPKAVEVVDWYYQDYHSLPPIDETLGEWIKAVIRGIGLWDHEHATGGLPPYRIIRNANHNPALGQDNQATVDQVIHEFPIRTIAAIGGFHQH